MMVFPHFDQAWALFSFNCTISNPKIFPEFNDFDIIQHI